MGGTIVYYVVSPVHVRNAELLAREMPDWTFCIVYQMGNVWLNADFLSKIPFEKVALLENRVPDALWAGDVKAAIFSTAQPHQGFISLLSLSLKRDIPTIAIEESNQIALYNGGLNNYVLPVDHILMASACERQGMMRAGFPGRRIEVTGWPFYAGQVGKSRSDRVRAMKKCLGLDPERLVATLTLTGLNDAGESPVVRRRQLTLAAQGLPQEYQLVVKPHPIERLEVLMPFVAQCAPRARVIEGMVRIDDVLEATDVLLNRGGSQVCLEALFHEVPVIILDTGIQTPFHGLAQDLIVEKPDDLVRALRRLSDERDPMRIYSLFKEMHVPFSPLEARALTCRRIAEIAENRSLDSDRAGQWFDLALYQAWRFDRRRALDMLAGDVVCNSDRPAGELKRLLQFQATRDDLEALVQYVGEGFRSYVLRCLWIDQLNRRKERLMDSDLRWMETFPPSMNTVWFLEHVKRWAYMLLRSGRSQAAKDFAQKVQEKFIHVPGMTDVVYEVDLYLKGTMGRTGLFVMNRARAILRPIKQKLRTFVFHRRNR